MGMVDVNGHAPTLDEPASLHKVQTLLAVTRLTLVLLALVIVPLVSGAWIVPGNPLSSVLPMAGAYGTTVLMAHMLGRRGAVKWASWIYVLMTALGLFAASFYAGGPTGPVSLLFVPLIIIALLTRGRGFAIVSALAVALVAGTWVTLQELGLLAPYEVAGSVERWLIMGTFLTGLGLTVWLLVDTMRSTEDTMALAQRERQALTDALQRAKAEVGLEGEARAQAIGTLEGLQDLAQDYTAFLNRVEEGDAEARLDLDKVSARVQSPALLALGARLNRTVDAMATVSNELRAVQRRYVQEAWSVFLESRPVNRGLRAAGGEVSVTSSVWRESMVDAARFQRRVVLAEELALPITVRDEVVGALGAHREDGNPWSSEELALVEAVTDQLGQTLETLRLVEETRRQAQREQVLGDLSGRFGRSFDVDALLQEAVMDLGQLLELDEVAVFLEPPVSAGNAAAGGALVGSDGLPAETEGGFHE